MSHDPERSAAEYLGGSMSRRRRRSFEAHILECEDCWSELELGRSGRTVAEAGRELAPQFLRERVRASVEALESRPHRLRWRMSAGLVVVAAVALSAVLWIADGGQPPAIDAILADFHGQAPLSAGAPARLPDRLGDLRLVEVRAGDAAGLPVVEHTYEDAAGHVVSVYQSEARFPVAQGADHSARAPTWTARPEGTVMFCSDSPIPSLVVGDDRREVIMAATELDLR
ncbi:MAG: hypothetical protein ACRDJJ_00275 [Actinomycetota bacterium]